MLLGAVFAPIARAYTPRSARSSRLAAHFCCVPNVARSRGGPYLSHPMSVPAADRLRLGVNIDHVATVRNARGSGYPDPVRAALLAAEAGADGITAHLREDRGDISDQDIARLSAELTIPLHLEMG